LTYITEGGLSGKTIVKGSRENMKIDQKQRTEVALPQDLKKDLRVFCAKNEMTLRSAVIAAVTKFIKGDAKGNQQQK
jgi:hypothetical protein